MAGFEKPSLDTSDTSSVTGIPYTLLSHDIILVGVWKRTYREVHPRCKSARSGNIVM